MIDPGLARIRSFDVIPSLPKPLEPLLEVANNLWWSWHPEAVALFTRIDPQLWERSYYNPVKMLGSCSQSRLDAVARDEGFLTALHHIVETLQRHLNRTPWLAEQGKNPDSFSIAYFCSEFGLAECLPIYSGGLGCLAGDHLKSAGELGLPLVGVGLLYRYGYFQQYLNADGWQQEYYADQNFDTLPLAPVTDAGGRQLTVSVDMPDRQVQIGLWKVRVGRVDLYLLDTNRPENDDEDRAITAHLYGGDMEVRIKQEIVLGIGGVRALHAVGIQPDICHMNEGHSAFLALERIRELIQRYDISFDEAREQAAASHVFTTHTPVPAGIDRFAPEIIEHYFDGYHQELRLDMEGLLALGRENVSAKDEFFSMAVLALRTASWYNAVSALHGHVSRNMWRNIWPGISESEVPITHITNGVHARSWMSPELINMLDGYLGAGWQKEPSDSGWQAINEVPDEELWRIHENVRRQLVVWTRRRLRQHLEDCGSDPAQIAAAADALDPNALTIGFARRFATYKRGSLFLRNPDRLRALLDNCDRPVQLIIAGKAHPADSAGKELIRQIIHFGREFKMDRHIVFVENYDIHVARRLVQGCDVWLNTPCRGMEASGTSGMKAALNGVLNCSILDGWWDEAFQNDLGWAIGRGEGYHQNELQDDIESQALYDLLEEHIVPLFYDRDADSIPRKWVGRMKNCISTLAPRFNTNRMVRQYTEQLYLPALRRARQLAKNDLQGSIELAHQKDRLRAAWGRLRIDDVEVNTIQPLGVGDDLALVITVHLADLQPDELSVQVYFGDLDNDGQVPRGQIVNLKHAANLGGGQHRFSGAIATQNSGRHGFAVRIVPGGEMFNATVSPGLIYWEQTPIESVRSSYKSTPAADSAA